MLPGIGWTELLLIAAMAIIVVGPRELPFLMRKVGRFMGQARAMAREFQDSFEDIAREAELEELRKRTRETAREIEKAASPLSPEEEEDLVQAHNQKVLEAEQDILDAGGSLDDAPAGPFPPTGETLEASEVAANTSTETPEPAAVNKA